MYKILYFLIVFVIVSISLKSQAPGFMGKKFVGGYGFHFSPATYNSNGNGKSIFGRDGGNAETGTFALNTMHEAYIEYATKNRFSIGFSARYFKTTYDNVQYAEAIEAITNSNGQTYFTSVGGRPNGFYTIKGINYNLYGKLFYSRHVAPWGRYMMFGLNIRTYTCIYDPNEMYVKSAYYNSTYTTFSDFGPLKQRFIKFDLLFGLGRSRIISNRIVLDYGFNTNLISLLNTLFDAVGEDFFLDNKYTNTNYLKRTSSFRVRGLNRFNAFLKIGYMF